MPNFHGIVVKLGEHERVLPKLTCGILRREWPRFTELRKKVAEGGSDAEDLLMELSSVQNALLLAAFKRNYPEMKVEELEENLSPGEATGLFQALMSLSSMTKSTEDKPAGEAVSPRS